MLTIWTCSLSSSVFADIFKFKSSDPLLVLPPVVTAGVMLPGDSEPFTCEADFHFSDIKELSLQTAMVLALCNNPQLKAAWASIKVQSALAGEVRAAYLPTVTATLSFLDTRVSKKIEGIPLKSMSRGDVNALNLNWRLFDFGARSSNDDSSEYQVLASVESHQALMQSVLASLIESYFNVLTAQAVENSRMKAVESAESSLTAVLNREKNGFSAASDFLQARLALAKAQIALARARAEVKKTIVNLNFTMGMPPSVVVVIPPHELDIGIKHVPDLNSLFEKIPMHPSILAALAKLNALKSKEKAARAEGLPNLDFTYSVNQNGTQSQGFSSAAGRVQTAGINLNIPIFSGFSRTYKINGAKAQIEESQALLQEVQAQVNLSTVKAHADAVSAHENLSFSQAMKDAAVSALESSERRYNRGVADIFELLNSKNAVSEAELERIRCISEWRSASLRLLTSSGQIGSKSFN